jgi:dTDP-4-dehydrorhamnose 3,5-epimerase-like enzyme
MTKRINNKIIKSKSGKIFKILDKNSIYFKNFGEIYLNHIRKSKKKADWIFHKRCQCLITVTDGKVNFIFKKNLNKKKIITLDSKKNQLLTIPPKTWFRFECKTDKATFLNLIDRIHDPKETIRDSVD